MVALPTPEQSFYRPVGVTCLFGVGQVKVGANSIYSTWHPKP